MLVVGGRRANLLLAPGRGRRLMFLTDPKNKVVTTRAMAKANHPGVGDTSELLASQGIEHVSITTSLDILDRISRRGRDPKYMGHHSLKHQWDSHQRILFLLTPAWAKGTNVSPRVLRKHLLIRRRATWTKA